MQFGSLLTIKMASEIECNRILQSTADLRSHIFGKFEVPSEMCFNMLGIKRATRNFEGGRAQDATVEKKIKKAEQYDQKLGMKNKTKSSPDSQKSGNKTTYSNCCYLDIYGFI